MKWEKPKKKRLKLFFIVAIVYIIIAWFSMYLCPPQLVLCTEATLHEVPSYFPESQGCYACTSSGGLVYGYIQLVILNFVLPIAIFYGLSGIKYKKK